MSNNVIQCNCKENIDKATHEYLENIDNGINFAYKRIWYCDLHGEVILRLNGKEINSFEN